MPIFFIFILILVISCLLGCSLSNKEIKIGEKAPLFKLYNQNGEMFSLEDYKGKELVIYFFPRTFTPGWVKQACEFRDKYDIFRKNNIEVIGISYDSQKKSESFSNKYSLKFPILSDIDKKVSKLYGIGTFLAPKRVTFLVDKNGNISDIVKNISLDNYAGKIIERFKKNNTNLESNVEK